MQIKNLISVNKINFKQQTTAAVFDCKKDVCEFENSNANKKVFIDRKIIFPSKNINTFFDEISEQIFDQKNDKNYFNSQTILMGTLYAVEVIIDTENYKGNWYDEDKVIFKIFPNISEIIDDTNIDEEIPEVDSDGDNSADGEENV
jgi:hypothetical protein